MAYHVHKIHGCPRKIGIGEVPATEYGRLPPAEEMSKCDAQRTSVAVWAVGGGAGAGAAHCMPLRILSLKSASNAVVSDKLVRSRSARTNLAWLRRARNRFAS